MKMLSFIPLASFVPLREIAQVGFLTLHRDKTPEHEVDGPLTF